MAIIGSTSLGDRRKMVPTGVVVVGQVSVCSLLRIELLGAVISEGFVNINAEKDRRREETLDQV
jgi:hypothetical protein